MVELTSEIVLVVRSPALVVVGAWTAALAELAAATGHTVVVV